MFCQFQVYSAYSFQESTLLIKDIVNQAKEVGYKSVGLCDSNMLGTIEFYKACMKENIKPIIGLEARIKINEEVTPFILLALNNQGYHNLCKISSIIYQHEFIEYEDLLNYKNHLLILNSGNDCYLERMIAKELYNEAKRVIAMIEDDFKDCFYINLHKYHNKTQDIINEKLIDYARLFNVKVVCSNEVRYLVKEDAFALELLKASKESRQISIYENVLCDEMYFKDQYRMELDFDDIIIHETSEMLDRIDVEIEMGKLNLPKYPIDGNSDDYLKQLCITGLKKRFNHQNVPKAYIQRLKEELDIIIKMKYSDYFLIVFDYVRYAKKNGILVGPGRGSAAGSLVSYVLGITNVDPLEYDLLFERFLNPERVSMPDIDIDFQDNRRDEVIDYVINKYGQEYVCGIVTFNTYGPRVAIKDLGKCVGIPLPKLERVSSMVPTNPKFKKSISQMYQESASFYKAIESDEALKKIFRATCLVERLPRNISRHAAGIVLSKDKLMDLIPLAKGPSDVVLSQYSKDHIEDIGLLKMDVRVVHIQIIQ